jgi:glycolate oxidase
LTLVAALRDALGDIVDVTEEALEAARSDRSGHRSPGRPLAIVHAESVAHVQQTMRLATAHRTPVVVRGAGTGLAGAANAGPGEIVLSTARMTRVSEILPDDLIAVVEPGILNADLNALLAEHGLWWPPDPASRDISTVGGNISTGAGGLLCAKYGVVRDCVLAIDLVLADGRLLHLGHRSVKGVTGLDLTSLVIGSEGTLGIVVGATLKLRRAVEGETCTLTALFSSVRAAAEGSAAVTASGTQPAIMELIDAAGLAAVHAYLSLPASPPATSQLTIQTDGPTARADADRIADVLREAGAAVSLTYDRAEGEHLLMIRRSMHGAFASLGTTLIEDVSVPRSTLPAMYDEIARIEQQYGLVIPTIAHAGDGNLHPNFIFEGEEAPEVVWAAADDLFRSAIRLGGTLTGEHGVGVLKSRWLAEELGEDQWEIQRQIKGVFDPLGILNPGKVFAHA